MKEKKDHHFIKKPVYEGGNKAFREFIYKNLKYPKEALAEKIEGVVLCRYEIDYKGNVSKVKVKKGIGYGCDEEAIRVLSLLKFIIPKEPRKLRVSFQKETKIKFQIPKPKKVSKPSKSTMTYTVTSKNKPKEDIPKVKKPTKKSYSYTIKW
ncbi:MAG: TonB family protein [Saprospiraceae bacterium]|nr:energy transducer TonB [Bacteroidia bacterium]NNE15656.1 TonB family protein [Saprospiraceae bacterium]NNL92406.1 TonB family protein [Saprospiraceae bacterium]